MISHTMISKDFGHYMKILFFLQENKIASDKRIKGFLTLLFLWITISHYLWNLLYDYKNF